MSHPQGKYIFMTYTDKQLKQALAKMLPETVCYEQESLYWQYEEIRYDRPVMNRGNRILDTELLHLCWLVEETLTEYKSAQYSDELIKQCSADAKNTAQPNNWSDAHATWQQRVTALAKVKGIKI